MTNNSTTLATSVPITEPAPRKVWSLAEKKMLAPALLLAVLFDRLVVNVFMDVERFRVFPAFFWLAVLAVLYVVFWEKVKHDGVLWFVAACTAALSLWNVVFPVGNSEFRAITFLVIPAVLMAHAQWISAGFSYKSFDGAAVLMVAHWFEGWFVKPFSGLPAWWGVSTSLVSEENKPLFKRASVGFAAAFGVLVVVVPLLMSADRVFGYYVSAFFSGFRLFPLVFHGIVIVGAFGWFFSFLWNMAFGVAKPHANIDNRKIDTIITTIVLGSVSLVYILFCIVQFTYLFAQAGLPAGMTFSEYAREGFAQTVVVCAINLALFGIFMWRGEKRKLITALLALLLSLTAVMLFSGWVRLGLYIDTFGMTWLRLISAWFIIYLAAVIALGAGKLFVKKDLPVILLSSLILLAWYAVLGFLNPDGFIAWFNGGLS